MICFMAIPSLRKLGKQAELRLFNKKVEELGYDSMEVLLASLFYRFALDRKCAVLIVRIPQVGDEPIKGLKITKEIPKKRMAAISWDMICLAQETLGESYTCAYYKNGCAVFMKHAVERGDWDGYEYELTGKDGVSIPAKFARGSR